MDQSEEIRFRFRFRKFLAALQYVASQRSLSTLEVSKVLFYADKYHLTRYGRPVTGDAYVAMLNGPVPSSGYDWLKNAANAARSRLRLAGDKRLDLLLEAVRVEPEKSYATFSAPHFTMTDWLSDSDREALDNGLEECRGLSMGQLIDKSHQEEAWQRADENGRMDLRLLFDPDNEEQQNLLELLRENQEAEDYLDGNADA
ncbi:MAG TPA: Panacea domain-containing protein [Acidobacteriota bacterium]|nr:Panacea domain-containing protein [Acidobacteriota bacterium]